MDESILIAAVSLELLCIVMPTPGKVVAATVSSVQVPIVTLNIPSMARELALSTWSPPLKDYIATLVTSDLTVFFSNFMTILYLVEDAVYSASL